MKKFTTIFSLWLLTCLSSAASAGIIPFKVTYTPTSGDVFHSVFTVDTTGASPGDFIPALTFSSTRSPNEWIQGIDSGGVNLVAGADLVGFTDALLDGQLFDDAAPAGDGAILSHDAFAETFRVYLESAAQAGDPDIASGTFSILQVPAPGILPLLGLGLAVLGWQRRRAAT